MGVTRKNSGFIQVFGEDGSQEQVKGQCAELLKLKTVDDRLRFLEASPKTCMNPRDAQRAASKLAMRVSK